VPDLLTNLQAYIALGPKLRADPLVQTIYARLH